MSRSISSFVLAVFLSSNAYAEGTAYGNRATAAANSTAYGYNAQATGEWSTAIGTHAFGTKPYSTVTGAGSRALNAYTTVIGASSGAQGAYSTVVGAKSHAEGENSVALGANSRANKDNEVNIGLWTAQDGVYEQTGTRILSGISDGENPDEAVNRKQLYEVSSSTAAAAHASAISAANANTSTEINKLDTKAQDYASAAKTDAVTEANTYTDNRTVQIENNVVARSNDYTNHRFDSLKNKVDRNERRANGGIAGAMAMSSIMGAGSGFGMAVSGYRNQGAIAAGIQKSITRDTSVNVKAAWDSGNGAGVAAGFFMSW